MGTTSFLIDDRIAIDAGALARRLSVEEQARIDHVFFTHSHLDHVVGLPFLLDSVFEERREPVIAHGSEQTLAALEQHVFNNVIWPDFRKLCNAHGPLLAFEALEPGRVQRLGDVALVPFALDHSVPCLGYLVQSATGSVAICGDTCSIDGLLEALGAVRNLKAVILEASFPRALEAVAKASRHLSTDGLAREVARLPPDLPVLVTHLKPECADVIADEIAALGLPQVALLEEQREYEF